MTPFPVGSTEQPVAAREPNPDEKALIIGLNAFQASIHTWAVEKGFWDFKVEVTGASEQMIIAKKVPIENDLVRSTKLMLMVTELAECLEGLRNGTRNEAEELADCTIRILDYCGAYKLPLAIAIINKMTANYQRPHKHGKAF